MHKRGAHEKQQILSKSQEATLVQWIGYQAAVAKPLDRDDIASLAFDISSVAPGTNWIYCFEQRHTEIRASQPGNLDLKHAQNFNPTNITYFYKLLKDVHDAFPNLPLNTSGTWMRRASSLGEATNIQRSTITSEA